MKSTLTILLLSLSLLGCSQKQTALTGSAIDRIQPSKDISFGSYVLHVEKREGASIEGVRITSREPNGQIATVTAERGTLSQAANRSFITVVLHDAQIEKAKQKASTGEVTVNLPCIGL